jgi:hypothetical protein
MPRPTAHATWSRDAWQRAVVARQAMVACELEGADRLSESASRLRRATERLDESSRRIDRAARA